MDKSLWSNESIVYAIKHKYTDRIYVGCTGCSGRVEKHLHLLANGKHPVPLMQSDCNLFGFNYSAYILEQCPKDGATDREWYWINKFKTYDREYGYNYRDKRRVRANVEMDGFDEYQVEGKYFVRDDGSISIDKKEFARWQHRKGGE